MRSCRLLWIAISVLSFQPAQAQSRTFGSSYWKWVEDRKIDAYPLPDSDQGAGAPTPLPSTPEANKLLELYGPRVEGKVDTWQSIELPSSLKIGSSQPVEGFYNTHIIRALKDERTIAVFRPVYTTTGCQSGCTPVMFHLELSPDGKTLAIIEDPDKPLRKIWHEPFSESDKTKTLSLAQKLPAIFDEIAAAGDLTDNSIFPPQTLTVYSEFTVPGAAYTSYRIFEAALKSKIFLTQSFHTAEVRAERKIFVNALRVSSVKQADKYIEKILKTLKKSDDASLSERRAALHILPKLWAWKAQQEGKPKKALKQAQEMVALTPFKKGRIRSYCDARLLLMESNNGRRLILEMNKTPKKWPVCGREFDQGIVLLAGVQEKVKEKDLRKTAGKWDFSRTPLLFQGSPQLLESYSKAASVLGSLEQSQRISAELRTRFPHFTTSAPETNEAHLKAAEDEYRSELRRLLLKERIEFPELVGVMRSSKVVLPLRQKQVYLFFASWCPHCREVLAQLGSGELNKELFAKIQLVEVFVRESGIPAADVCAQSNLPSNLCSDMVSLPSSVATDRGLSRMNLFSVPRFYILDAERKIASLDFEFNFSQGRAPLRDLKWLLEELSR